MDNDRSVISSAKPLAVGHEILWYTIESVLGRGGFGITYLAQDRNLDRSVAIKEYLPVTFAYRHDDHSVKPLTGQHEEDFSWGLSSFLNEAQTLAKFSHDNIVRVHSVFEQNSTAYMVMEYEQGDSLATLYKQQRQFRQADLENVFFPIFDGLGAIHRFGFIHRDIKPGNIYLRGDGTPVLIDFGSARETSRQETGEMTTLVSHGYTPLEQYSSSYGEQGPWTDVYSLAATLYEGVTGMRPDTALNRAACRMRNRPDIVAPLATADYPAFTEDFLGAIAAGLCLEPEERPADLVSWRPMFKRADIVADDRLPVATDDFDQLDDDRTRLQPAPVGRASKTAGSGAGRRAPSDSFGATPAISRRGAADTPDFAFDIDPADLEGVNTTSARRRRSSDASERPSGSRRESRKRKGGALPIIGGLAFGAIVALGAWWYIAAPAGPGSGSGTDSALARIDTLPKPLEPVALELPSEREIRQLGDLLTLAKVFGEAHALDARDPRVLDGVQSAYARLERAALAWNGARHPTIARRIIQVANALPGDEARRARILRLVEGTDNAPASEDIVALVAAGSIVEPEGASVIDRVTALDVAEFGSLERQSGWQHLITGLNEQAASRIDDGDFDTAARLIETSLTLAPGDPTSVSLRAHLAGR